MIRGVYVSESGTFWSIRWALLCTGVYVPEHIEKALQYIGFCVPENIVSITLHRGLCSGAYGENYSILGSVSRSIWWALQCIGVYVPEHIVRITVYRGLRPGAYSEHHSVRIYIPEHIVSITVLGSIPRSIRWASQSAGAYRASLKNVGSNGCPATQFEPSEWHPIGTYLPQRPVMSSHSTFYHFPINVARSFFNTSPCNVFMDILEDTEESSMKEA